ncbi:sigma-54-dependent Fis family transcriptional regulator [Vibrio salinus]|uniref:sigma-54-dependent Fis family transcriptional regulator n=1 Tax=Vibrio salinus TaxID=2899784 RepID=UPI001E44CC55|nr:sigma 54-interacting transcriptional regulator [Vibrio salinus]MCE0495296.1 sigma 54-interacting transcriptional regulator [Vibrio salinus]
MSQTDSVMKENTDQKWYDEINLLPKACEADKINEQLLLAWNKFLEGSEPQGIRTLILNSWQRSLQHNVNPFSTIYDKTVTEEELAPILFRNREMIEIAKEVMQDLLAYNPDGHINLTDSSGVTLCYCGQNLTPIGSILREDVQGTNCTALCLIEKKPVYIVSGENWKIDLRKRYMQCAAAPVKNARGKMIGVLTLTSTQDNFNHQTLGTVHAAARSIRQQLILQDLLSEQCSILETLNEGVMVIDSKGIIKIANRYARQVFDEFELIGKHIDRELKPEDTTLLGIPPCNDREVIFNLSSNVRINCLISLVESPNGNRVISLKENQRIRDITRRVMGVGASYTFERIIGHSEKLQETLGKAKKASQSNSTVLLTGESGTGKELFAQAIHNNSGRRNGPFIAVNCGALPKDLVQSELFGYVDGAYTGARSGGAPGKFELAEGGTLFLDEIGEMPLEAQTSLLRVLQEGEVIRIGAAKPNKINVRIVAATNCNLIKAIDNSAFRRDLYYRLNVISIPIPPLRERSEDIRDLIEFFSSRICNSLKKIQPSFTKEALKTLADYSWPGNIRELENIIERLINLNSGLKVDISDLPEEFLQKETIKQTDSDGIYHANDILVNKSKNRQSETRAVRSGSVSLEGNEKTYIIQLLTENNGNIRKTSETLQISRNCLYNKLKKWEINVSDYRK